ncbi:MAG: TPM domain-containing protein [Bacteroidetes bacterium]|nr:TPM domain-containing protein [Bacteroidota bacterium]
MKNIFTYLLLLLSSFLIAQNDNLPDKPSPPTLVTNLSKQFPDFISKDQQNALEQKLVRFSDSTSNQIAIIIADDLNGLEASDYAVRIGEKWGIGTAKNDNGIVLLIKPSENKNERDVFIAIGRGLEGRIPDITTKHIIENELIPNFKNGDYYQGLEDATNALMLAAKEEYNIHLKKKSNTSLSTIILIIIIVIIIASISNKFNGGAYSMGRRGGYYGNTWGGFGGGGFGGSSGGGGFGGFGGGSFGGGGAGGKW